MNVDFLFRSSYADRIMLCPYRVGEKPTRRRMRQLPARWTLAATLRWLRTPTRIRQVAGNEAERQHPACCATQSITVELTWYRAIADP